MVSNGYGISSESGRKSERCLTWIKLALHTARILHLVCLCAMCCGLDSSGSEKSILTSPGAAKST